MIFAVGTHSVVKHAIILTLEEVNTYAMFMGRDEEVEKDIRQNVKCFSCQNIGVQFQNQFFCKP